MKEVYQKTKTDCTEACIASIFEIDIEDVPELPNNDTWITKVNEWLLERGLYLVCVRFEEPEQAEVIKGFSIGCIPSNRFPGELHSVVCCDGMIIWDPVSGRHDGTKRPDNWLVFCIADPSKNRFVA